MRSPELSLVLPAYNSRAYMADHVRRVVTFFEAAGIAGEVIVADDGSTDGTAESVPRGGNTAVLALAHGGKGAALRAGMTAARGEIIGFTDADLPYGMSPLRLALTYIRERRYHAVVGDRTLPGSTYESAGVVRSLVSGVASFAFRTLVTGGIYDTQCGFKVFRGDVAKELFRLSTIDGFAIDVELIYLLLKYRLDLKRIPVQLENNASSSVRVARDSAQAAHDIVRMRLNWATGRYDSPTLRTLLARELAEDVSQAEMRLVK